MMGVTMVQISVFETSDGSHFLTKREAEEYNTRTDIKGLVAAFYSRDMLLDEIVDGIMERASLFRAALDAV